MTANQIAYLNHLEAKRHNAATEELTQRDQAERARSNLAQENLKSEQIDLSEEEMLLVDADRDAKRRMDQWDLVTQIPGRLAKANKDSADASATRAEMITHLLKVAKLL